MAYTATSSGSFLAKIEPCYKVGLSSIGVKDDERNIDVSEFHKANEVIWTNYWLNILAEVGQKLVIYPNPVVNNKINLQVVTQSNKIQVKVVSSLGNLVKDFDKQFVAPGIQRFDLDVSKLNAGNYFIQVIEQNTITARQFTKL